MNRPSVLALVLKGEEKAAAHWPLTEERAKPPLPLPARTG